MDTLTTFSDRREYERAARLLEGLGIEHTVITPDPAYARVGCPALAFSPEARVAFLRPYPVRPPPGPPLGPFAGLRRAPS